MSSISGTSLNILSTTLGTALRNGNSFAKNDASNTASLNKNNVQSNPAASTSSADKYEPSNKSEQKLVNAAKAYVETAHLVSVLDGFKDLLSEGLPGRKNSHSKNSRNFFTNLNQLQSLTTPYSNKGNDIITTFKAGQINTGDGNDIVTSHKRAQINAGNGNDIINSYGSFSQIDGGDGNDIIKSYGFSTIDAGNGNDFITAYGNGEINGGAGNDIITSYNGGKINAGAGNDVITSYGFAQINAGQGDDKITIRGSGASYNYNKGDGSDTINTNSNISINLDGFSSDDISVAEEKGRTIISFKGSAEKLTLNLQGTATARLNFAYGNPINV